MKLLYRGTRDGMTSKNFHDKCDNKGKTICLCLNNKQIKFILEIRKENDKFKQIYEGNENTYIIKNLEI